MAIVKVSISDEDQVVRLPKDLRLEAEEVEVTRQGEGLLLMPRRHDMARFIELLRELPDDMFVGLGEHRSPEERDEL